jgi:hypothetical protein
MSESDWLRLRLEPGIQLGSLPAIAVTGNLHM